MKLVLEKIYFCTGARNHDLLKAFGNYCLEFEYDERMASFKALGLAKITAAPVAICTTSGTAVAECLPALLEAKYSGVPLVLITGDRPKKLHATGSPQTIDHQALTACARGSYFEVSLEELDSLELSGAVYPVHINVLVDDTTAHQLQIKSPATLQSFSLFLGQHEKPLFIFSHEEMSMRPFVEKFAQTGLPFYAEALSGGRHLSVIKSERDLIKLWDGGTFDCVVRVGHTPLSKIWRLLERRHLDAFHFDTRGLSGLSYGEVSTLSSRKLLTCEEFWAGIARIVPFTLPSPASANLQELQDKYPHSEVSMMKQVHDRITPDDVVYLGNSLIIRNFELVLDRPLTLYGSRGVNGIDGQLATAIGIAQGTSKRVYCILGDITTLYDLSSMREMPENLRLIIINNKGGRIFDLLKLDRRIVLEHQVSFGSISRGFGLKYSQDLADLEHVAVVELNPSLEESELFQKGWLE
ncbi:MAG TPA: thiamine pyrophosphate-binding protein [Bacteriovoracaceae bacterium]|nr:thiamine pyrophosphate-binding protein [Bacteriovoracaceae bacterium]